jgi:heptosyltransferase-1
VRVLLTRLSSLGDVVHTWPLAAALARAGHSVGWVVEPAYAPLVALAPGVERVVEAATRRWRRRPLAAATRAAVRAAVDDVRDFAADVVLDPQGLLKSAVWARLSGCRRRVGLALPHRAETLAALFYSETVRPIARARHVVDHNLALLSALGIEPPWGESPDGRFLLGAHCHPSGGGHLVLLPAAGSRAKAWPAERWAALARGCLRDGHGVTVACGPGEELLGAAVVGSAGPAASLAPPTTLPELAALLGSAAAVVGGDTGPLHLAASLGVPTLGVYFATDPERTGPRGLEARTVRGPARRRGPAVEAVHGAVRDLLGDASG